MSTFNYILAYFGYMCIIVSSCGLIFVLDHHRRQEIFDDLLNNDNVIDELGW